MNMQDMRKVYGETLVKLGEENERIVALEADLGKSTMSILFSQRFPQRYFQMGIAEANMASAAAGLSLSGYIPFIHSFAVFATGRSFDQIRSSICIPHLNVKICGSSAGLSDFGDGKTHQSVDDIAIMRVLPGMHIYSPADALETEKAVRAAAAVEGPCYIRLNRNPVPTVTEALGVYDINCVQRLRGGSDVMFFTTGYMTALALAAAEKLAGEGISAGVANVAVIKPLDEEGVRREAAAAKAVVTVEEASIYGGLGGAVCEALACGNAASRKPVLRIGTEDVFGTSAQNYAELLAAYHFTPDELVKKAKQALSLA